MVSTTIGTRVSIDNKYIEDLSTKDCVYIITTSAHGKVPVMVFLNKGVTGCDKMSLYHNDKSSYIRTPKSLSNYIGKTMLCYKEIFKPIENEVCRLRPLDFVPQWLDTKTSLNNIKINVPYITTSKMVFLPQDYINKYMDDSFSLFLTGFNASNHV